MSQTQRYFLFLLVTGPIHLGEQLATSIEEFYMLRSNIADPYYAMFAAADTDRATVLLIAMTGAILSAIFYALSAGGGARLATLALFGLGGVGEIHHVIEAAMSASYDPGVITAVPYFWYGCRLLGAVWREWSADAGYGLQAVRF